jgi:hypothetical protein
LGLYLYDKASDANKKDKALRNQQIKDVEPLLPTSNGQAMSDLKLDAVSEMNGNGNAYRFGEEKVH